MQLDQLQTAKKKAKRRVGRGGKRGTYSGKGMKGQKSRAGHKIRPQIRDTVKKIPKKRGYRFKTIKKVVWGVNLDLLEKKFQAGSRITPKILIAAGLIKREGGKIPKVKILGSGDLTKKLFISGCLLSGQAKEKIEKAKGVITNSE